MDHQKVIIVVEDDLSVQEAIELILDPKGYRVIFHNDGEQLVDAEFETPDLFIIDKQLPGVDGLDLCRMLKGRERTRHLPVIVLSASPQAGASAKEAGADAFLEKPFKMQVLRTLVAELMG